MTGLVARWRASYAPGSWFVLSGPTSLVVLDPSADPAMIKDLWAEVVASASMVELAGRLAAYGLEQMPSLGAFFWAIDGMRSLVRGNVSVVDLDSGDTVADGHGILTWSEVGLAGTTRVGVSLTGRPDPAGVTFPLVVGVVTAATVWLDATKGAEVVSPQTPEAAKAAPGSSAADSPTPMPPDQPVVGQEVEWGHWGDLRREKAGAESTLPVAAAAVTSPTLAEDTDLPTELEMMSLHTQDEMPPAPSPGPVERNPPVDLDTADTQLMAPGSPPSPTASVPADICPHGHANPPNSPACRICGAPIARQQPTLIPQPLLARLRCVDGTVVDLDRTVLIGRAPSEQSAEALLPRLMSVPSPGGDISRTHLQVSPVGWQVVVTDLHSTNGTRVLRADTGGMRQVLAPGEATEIPIGSVLELGDGVTVVIDAPT